MGQPPPMISTAKSFGAIRIRNREYIQDIYTSFTAGAFRADHFLINPGLYSTFPWLARIAGCFQSYKFNALMFQFRSTSADALTSTNTALGTVVVATNYNSVDPPYQNKSQMENSQFGKSVRTSQSVNHYVECSNQETALSTHRYTRSQPVPSNQDARLYDLAQFSIASVGSQGMNSNIGELWVSYDISLFKPIEPSVTNLWDYRELAMRINSNITASTPYGTAGTVYDRLTPTPITNGIFYSDYPLQGTATAPVDSTMRIEVTAGGQFNITFPKNNENPYFTVLFYWNINSGTSGTVPSIATNTLSNLTLVQNWSPDDVAAINVAGNGLTGFVIAMLTVKITNNVLDTRPVLSLHGPTQFTTVNGGALRIRVMNAYGYDTLI